MADATRVIRIIVDASQAKAGGAEAKRSLDMLQDAANRLKSTLVGLFAGLATTAFLRQVVEVSARFEALQASLKTVTGSAEAATASFAGIQKFAATTPFDLAQATEAFIKLKSLGLDASIGSLTSYGNTASAMGKSLNQMIEAVADAATGEFERLKEFGIRASQQGQQVTFTFQGVSTTVAKEAGAITEYLRKIGDVNFAGAMDEQAKTLGGALSNLGDAWDGFLYQIGRGGFAGAIADGARSLAEMATEANGLARNLGALLGAAVRIATGALELLNTYLKEVIGVAIALSALKLAAWFFEVARAISVTSTALQALDTVVGKGGLLKILVALGAIAAVKLGALDFLDAQLGDLAGSATLAGDALAGAGNGATAAGTGAGKAAKEYKGLLDAIYPLQGRFNDYAQQFASLNKHQAELARDGKTLEQAQWDLAEAFVNANGGAQELRRGLLALKDVTATGQNSEAAVQLVARISSMLSDASEKAAQLKRQAQQDQQKPLREYVEGLRREVGLLGLSNAERERIQTLEEAARAAGLKRWQDLQGPARQELEALIARREEFTRAEAAYEELGRIGEDAFDRIASAIDDSLVKGQPVEWANVWKAAIGEVIGALGRMALVNPIKNLLFNAGAPTLFDAFGGGTGGASSGGTAGGATQQLGFFGQIGNTLSNAWNFLSSGNIFGAQTSEFLNTIGADWFGLGGAPIQGPLLPGQAPMVTPGTSLSGVLSGAGIGMTIGSIYSMLGLGKQGPGSQIGGTIGGIAGSFVPIPGGSIIGSVLGSIIGGLFGPNPSVGPNATGIISRAGGQFVTGDVRADNGGDASAARSLVKNVNSALNAILDATGGKVSGTGPTAAGLGFLQEKFFYDNTKGLRVESDSADPVVIAAIRDQLLRNVSGLSSDVVSAIRKSVADTVEGFGDDISFAAGFQDALKAMKAGTLDFAASVEGAAKQQIAAATKSITDFIDKARELGLNVNAAKDAARAYVDTLLGLTPAQAQLSDTAKAWQSMIAQFQAAGPLLEAVGRSASEIPQLLAQAQAKFRAGFNQGIADQIRALTVDPLTAALEAGEKVWKQRLEDARLIGADLVQVTRLNELERIAIIKQATAGLTDWLEGQLLGPSSSLSPAAQIQAARQQLDTAIASRNYQGATSAADAYLSAAQSFYGMGTAQYGAIETFARQQLQGLVNYAAGAGPGPMADSTALQAKVDALTAELRQVRAVLEASFGVQQAAGQQTVGALNQVAANTGKTAADIAVANGRMRQKATA